MRLAELLLASAFQGVFGIAAAVVAQFYLQIVSITINKIIVWNNQYFFPILKLTEWLYHDSQKKSILV